MFFIGTKSVYASDIVERIYGSDRYSTAAQISGKGWDKSDYVILATGVNYPDALCATPLAKKYNAPILLTEKDKLNIAAEQEIKRLKASHIIIVGGYQAISSQVEEALIGDGIQCTRIYGTDRYDTSVKVAEQLEKSDQIIIATGANFPDTLSIAPYASMKNIPILLTSKSELPETVRAYISKQSVTKIYVIGGEGAVSEKILEELPDATRIAGADRYKTNIAVLNEFKNDFNYSNLYIATGANFPDALAGSALAQLTNSPILLVNYNLTEDSQKIITANAPQIQHIILLGGKNAVASIDTSENDTSSNQGGSGQSSTGTQDSSQGATGSSQGTSGEVTVSKQDEYYNVMKDALSSFADELHIKITNYDNKIYNLDIIDQVLNENPLIDYGYSEASAQISVLGTEADMDIKFKYSFTREVMNKMKQAAEEKAKLMVSNLISPGMTDYQKELTLHDYVINHARYDYVDYLNGSLPNEVYTDYGVLVNGIAVCEGYAKAMYRLLTLAGIETKYVVGDASDGSGEWIPHAWNIVKIGGQYYQLDTTWDDPVMEDGSDTLSHYYFNVTDYLMGKDHTWDRSKYPACTSTTYRYQLSLGIK